jgi:hypothetical protein
MIDESIPGPPEDMSIEDAQYWNVLDENGQNVWEG